MKRVEIPKLQPVDIDLPESMHRLYDLAYNLWWTWDYGARHLFAAIDEPSWRRYRNPVEILLAMDHRHWDQLAASERFMTSYRSVVRRFDRYMSDDASTWFGREHEPAESPVAYFSMEYGLHQSLPIYSGGLGVLSGDHCKAASDLGIPFVAVGLLYRLGYFNQTIDADGFQQHSYVDHDFHRLPLRHVRGPLGKPLVVTVPFPDREVSALVWVAEVGRVPLLLLDTDIPQNHPSDRPITSVLYVRGRETRLAQEVVLGLGGAKALSALGIDPGVWHINEGHSALLQLERVREELGRNSKGFEAAWSDIARSTAFTTHTPVPAGNEIFDVSIVRPFLDAWHKELKTSTDDLVAMGDGRKPDDSNGDEEQSEFNLTAFALRGSAFRNGVSRLNGEVASSMWEHLVAEEGAAPIGSITNGVHTPTWLGPELRKLFEEQLGHYWMENRLDRAIWERIAEIDPREIWDAHTAQKERLVHFIGGRLQRQAGRHGRAPEELRRMANLLDPKALTIGFARRFATYKRARLFFRDLDRLRGILNHADRPVQIILAGKAHPADRPGQELIQQIVQLTKDENLEGRVVFLESYDLRVGRMLVQGVDVWLNTPRRPLEASGTSGQKAGLNGVLNFSILDGWWPEGFNGENGWAIGGEETEADEEIQDAADALSLYDTLEHDVTKMFYDTDDSGMPAAWVDRMKNAITSVGHPFSAARMVRDYTRDGYLPIWKR